MTIGHFTTCLRSSSGGRLGRWSRFLMFRMGRSFVPSAECRRRAPHLSIKELIVQASYRALNGLVIKAPYKCVCDRLWNKEE